MAEAKKPQDHKPPKPSAEKVDGGQNVTVDGLTVFIAQEAMDDFELLDDLGRLDDGDGTRMPSVLRRLLTDEDREKVLEHLRGKNGRVSIEAGGTFIQNIFEVVNPNS